MYNFDPFFSFEKYRHGHINVHTISKGTSNTFNLQITVYFLFMTKKIDAVTYMEQEGVSLGKSQFFPMGCVCVSNFALGRGQPMGIPPPLPMCGAH